MSISRLLPAAVALLLALQVPALAKPTKPVVDCYSCILLDDLGRVLFARRADKRLANASTTKMVTALLVSDGVPVDSKVSVSEAASGVGGGGLDLATGESYSVLELLYALLLSSSNDAAVALAEHVDGSEAEFVEEMNRFAVSVGAHSTRFVTAHGLDRKGHFSSASDLAAIAELVLADPLLARIVRTPKIVLEGPHGPTLVENRNLLLESYKGAIGIKTGFTDRAGNVLVAAARRHGRTLIAVAMRSDDATADARKLLDYGWVRLRRSILVDTETSVGSLVFDPGGSVEVVASEAIRGISHPETIAIEFQPDPTPDLPIEVGEALGFITVSDPNGVLATVSAVASGPVPEVRQSWWVLLLSNLLEAAAALIDKVGEIS